MSYHECPDCEIAVATNATTAGAFSIPPDIVCVECGAVMEVDSEITVDMDKVRR